MLYTSKKEHVVGTFMKRSALSCLAMAAIGVAYAPLALAQVNPPGSARPDIIQRQLNIQNPMPSVGGAPLIQTEEGQSVREVKGDVTFVLNSLKLENATVYGEQELSHIYKDHIGQKISLATLNQIAADITSFYRNNGYILTRAVVPPQRIKGGNVIIRIVEGHINEVRIEGEGAGDALIKAYGDKIRAAKPLDVKTLERYLLLMEDLPGVEARAVLQPSATMPGASDVVVNVTRDRYEFAATLDNRGSRFLGPQQLGLTAAFNNMLSANAQTQARVVSTASDELIFGELRHEEQLGTEGTKLVVSASHIQTRPEFTLEPFEIVGKSSALSAGVSHPYLRSRRENLFFNGDFTLRNVNVDSLDQDLYYDKTRVLTLGAAYDFVDSLSSVNRLEANVHRGFGAGTKINAQPNSRANASASFYKFTGRASRIQPVMGSWSVMGSASGQYSADPLTASEEFAIGGTEFGSAYDPAELTGDSGAAARLELQYNQAPGYEFMSQYQLYGFYDVGRVWNRDPVPGSEEDHVSLASTGLGVRFNINDAVSGGFEAAFPLTKDVSARGEDGDNARYFFNLQYRF